MAHLESFQIDDLMTLISLAIVVAFVASAAATLGFFEVDVWWEPATLITIMALNRATSLVYDEIRSHCRGRTELGEYSQRQQANRPRALLRGAQLTLTANPLFERIVPRLTWEIA